MLEIDGCWGLIFFFEDVGIWGGGYLNNYNGKIFFYFKDGLCNFI